MSILKIFEKSVSGPRELVVDIETTGFHTSEGHRVIEIAVVEMRGKRATGKEFHTMVNPECDIPEEVVDLTGIANEQVKDKPLFAAIARQLREFIGNDPIIITCRTEKNNYTLDSAFLNMEMEKAGEPAIPDSQFVNVRRWSEAMFGDKHATLDWVLDHYRVNHKERDRKGHGALLDARLLSDVYPKLCRDHLKFLRGLEEAQKPSPKKPPVP